MGSAKTQKVLRKHVTSRAKERFGIAITDDEITRINRLIQQGKAKLVDRQSNIVTRWIVPLRDLQVYVAYDKKRGCIRTVMPEEYSETVGNLGLVVIIEAKYDMLDRDIEDCIERGLDSLRERGEAREVSRKVLGVPKAK
jgi:hypothetical protein